MSKLSYNLLHVLHDRKRRIVFFKEIHTFNYIGHTRVIYSYLLLLDFSLTVKAATLILISGCGSAISSAKEGKSGFIYNLVKSK